MSAERGPGLPLVIAQLWRRALLAGGQQTLQAALATVVGVLVEVPVMLSVVRIVNASADWYGRAESRIRGG